MLEPALSELLWRSTGLIPHAERGGSPVLVTGETTYSRCGDFDAEVEIDAPLSTSGGTGGGHASGTRKPVVRVGLPDMLMSSSESWLTVERTEFFRAW
jgi:hypothetical protein